MSTTTLRQPSYEEQTQLNGERNLAATRLAEAQLLLDLAKTTPEGFGQDLLKFRLSGSKKPAPSIVKLEREVEGWQHVLDLVDARLKDWDERDEAYREAERAAEADAAEEAA